MCMCSRVYAYVWGVCVCERVPVCLRLILCSFPMTLWPDRDGHGRGKEPPAEAGTIRLRGQREAGNEKSWAMGEWEWKWECVWWEMGPQRDVSLALACQASPFEISIWLWEGRKPPGPKSPPITQPSAGQLITFWAGDLVHFLVDGAWDCTGPHAE